MYVFALMVSFVDTPALSTHSLATCRPCTPGSICATSQTGLKSYHLLLRSLCALCAHPAAPKALYKANVLVIESTCVERLHEKSRIRRKCLGAWGINVLILAFGICSVHGLLYELGGIFHRKALKALPQLREKGWGRV